MNETVEGILQSLNDLNTRQQEELIIFDQRTTNERLASEQAFFKLKKDLGRRLGGAILQRSKMVKQLFNRVSLFSNI